MVGVGISGRLLILAAVILAAALVPPSEAASSQTARPTVWSDPSSVTATEHLATDSLADTAANMSGGGNLTYSSFDAALTPTIFQLNLSYELSTSGFVDDIWAVYWSDNAGSSWNNLVYSSANATRHTNATILISAGGWSWAEVRQNLSVRFMILTNGTADEAELMLYDIRAIMLADSGGPEITLYSPVDDTISYVPYAAFSFSANDTDGNVTNCSLLIDGDVNMTNASMMEDATVILNASFGEGWYEWQISCYDNATYGQEELSAARTLTIDLSPPVVTLIAPANATPHSSGLPILLQYNFSDASPEASCTLLLDGAYNQTHTGATEGTIHSFPIYVENGEILWSVNCTDSGGRSGLSVQWILNVSNNQPPSVTDLIVPSNITVALGAATTVLCNATATDNESASITAASGRFYRTGHHGSALNPSVSYSNASCSLQTFNSTSRYVSCLFSLVSMAKAGSWVCEITANDSSSSSSGTVQSWVDPLYAINITPDAITYGGYQPGQLTGDKVLAIGNIGNVPIDIALDGYGLVDGDGLAMSCTIGSMPLANHRYGLNSGIAFASMTPLTDEPVQLATFDLAPSNTTYSSRNLYWKAQLAVPMNGTCSGFVTVTVVPT